MHGVHRACNVALLALLICGVAVGQGTERGWGSHPTIVEIKKTRHGVLYKVDSQPVTLTPNGNLLYLLNLVHNRRGSKAPVLVLIDPQVSIEDVWNLDGVAAKAQLDSVRYFVRIPRSENMTELRLGPSVPAPHDRQ
jgi:hypothetical protein